jgi:hypothetical protein
MKPALMVILMVVLTLIIAAPVSADTLMARKGGVGNGGGGRGGKKPKPKGEKPDEPKPTARQEPRSVVQVTTPKSSGSTIATAPAVGSRERTVLTDASAAQMIPTAGGDMAWYPFGSVTTLG